MMLKREVGRLTAMDILVTLAVVLLVAAIAAGCGIMAVATFD